MYIKASLMALGSTATF